MSMTSQGYPLWAVDSRHGNKYAVVGWIHGRIPLLAHLEREVSGTYQPVDGEAFTFTTTDPTAQADASREPEPGKPAAEWSEGDIRVVLRHIADRLAVLGATAPARRIREILESPAEPAPDDLRERLHRLADDLEDAGPSHIGRRIREELAK